MFLYEASGCSHPRHLLIFNIGTLALFCSHKQCLPTCHLGAFHLELCALCFLWLFFKELTKPGVGMAVAAFRAHVLSFTKLLFKPFVDAIPLHCISKSVAPHLLENGLRCYCVRVLICVSGQGKENTVFSEVLCLPGGNEASRWAWSLPVEKVGADAQSPAALPAPAKRSTV